MNRGNIFFDAVVTVRPSDYFQANNISHHATWVG